MTIAAALAAYDAARKALDEALHASIAGDVAVPCGSFPIDAVKPVVQYWRSYRLHAARASEFAKEISDRFSAID